MATYDDPQDGGNYRSYSPRPSYRSDSYSSERVIPDADLPTELLEGVLDIAEEGSGLLRPAFNTQDDRNVYISSSQIRRFNLRAGDMVGGQARSPKENERYWGLLKVETVNGALSDTQETRFSFDTLRAI